MHSKFVILSLHEPFVSTDLNALSTQRVCSTSISTYGVCVLCLLLEVLCVKCEEEIFIKLFDPLFRDSRYYHLKTVYCFIIMNAFVSNAL